MVKTKVRYLWEQRVTAYKTSNQTLPVWCKENDVKPARLRCWVREFKDIHTTTEKITSWVSVDNTELKITTKKQPLIVKIGAAAIEINSDFNKDLFSKVSEVLFSLC